METDPAFSHKITPIGGKLKKVYIQRYLHGSHDCTPVQKPVHMTMFLTSPVSFRCGSHVASDDAQLLPWVDAKDKIR